ncbi:MAG TPA: Rieske 2Fe-2S domain-containing protein [Jatrophihabitans sp.]|jgi:nitrite reductase/ring-hydroxylating ferredoxin subunit|nr:Rieske 2Fe-2S domain-containing protein [Jatrophihabitans sp.]
MQSWQINRSLETLVDRVERTTALDPAADRLAALVSKRLSASTGLRNVLSGTAAGHPLHPVLVVVPLGSWLGASYLDLTGGKAGRVAATKLVGLGIASAIPAAMAGINDWADTRLAERRVGFVHALGNELALGLYTGSWFARRRQRHGLGVALAASGALLLGVTGWLGGHLSYARGVGVDTTAFDRASEEWTDVLPEAELVDEQPTLVYDGKLPVLLVRTGGQLCAITDRCTHRGGPLHEGELSDGCIVCPWHGSKFRVSDGQVLAGPATRGQRAYEVRVQDGSIQLRHLDEVGSLRIDPVR